jgi:hypothetical protein
MEKTAMQKLAGEIRQYVKMGQRNPITTNVAFAHDNLSDLLRVATGAAGGFQLPNSLSFRSEADTDQRVGWPMHHIFSSLPALSRLRDLFRVNPLEQ